MYLGRFDSTNDVPSICAMCGEPLIGERYHLFRFGINSTEHHDMMFGHGCMKNRIIAFPLNLVSNSDENVWVQLYERFPNAGRWYGTFIHHHIAKPYSQNQSIKEKWSENLLELPGVRCIISTIDCLINEGYSLHAEMKLESGIADLVCIRDDSIVVIDWKTDIDTENLETHKKQISNYMLDLCNDNRSTPVRGYICYIREGKAEPVHITSSELLGLTPHENVDVNDDGSIIEIGEPVECKLTIDMDGGEGVRRKIRKETETIKRYGTEVTFWVRAYNPYKEGYEFQCFKCDPYRAGQCERYFYMEDLKKAIPISFITGKRRHTFRMKAVWKKVRSTYCCYLKVPITDKINETLFSKSCIEDETDSVNFSINDILSICLNSDVECLTVVSENPSDNMILKWTSDELKELEYITIPCSEDNNSFRANVLFLKKRDIQSDSTKKVNTSDKKQKGTWTEYYEKIGKNIETPKKSIPCSLIDTRVVGSSVFPIGRMFPSDTADTPQELSMFPPSCVGVSHDSCLNGFMVDKIYYSGKNRYRIINREEHSHKSGAHARVQVIKINYYGNPVSEPRWMNVYRTPVKHTEMIYDPMDKNVKVYASCLSKF